MEGKVLALVENNIATRLLLESCLSALGYQVIVVSSPRAFRGHLAAGRFGWLILDEAVLARARDLVAEAARQRREARIIWLGRPPRQPRLPIAAVFTTPLVYGEIARYFSRQEPRDARPPAGGEHKTGQSSPAIRSGEGPRCCRHAGTPVAEGAGRERR